MTHTMRLRHDGEEIEVEYELYGNIPMIVQAWRNDEVVNLTKDDIEMLCADIVCNKERR